MIETYGWGVTADSYALDSSRRRLKKAGESKKSLGSWRILVLTLNMNCHDSVTRLSQDGGVGKSWR